MSAPLVVFDLDGTLVDTAPDLIDTLNAVLAPEGLPAVTSDKMRHLVGGGARLMVERAFAMNDRTCDTATMDRLFATFITHYGLHIADRSRPFDGLTPALDDLERSGFRFAVCTNKLEGLARLLLDRLDLTRRFAFVCGQDTFGVPKPDPKPLLATIAAAGGDPDRTVMIGDSATDIRTARAASVPVVAVTFGYSDVPVSGLGADRVIGSLADLPKTVRNLVRAD